MNILQILFPFTWFYPLQRTVLGVFYVAAGNFAYFALCFLIFARADGEIPGISGIADTVAHPQQGS